jgi:hypothetical protein
MTKFLTISKPNILTEMIIAGYRVTRKYDQREHDRPGNSGAEVQYIDAEIFE